MKIELFEKARALGEAMAQTDEYKAVQEAQARIEEDEETQQMIARFNALQTTMQEMMQSPDPDKDAVAAMASSMRELQTQLTKQPSMQALNEAQKEFSEIINSVNQVLRFMITGEVAGEDETCGGNCATCKGC